MKNKISQNYYILLCTILLSSCISIWYPYYKVTASDGKIGENDGASDYTKLDYKIDSNTELDIMVVAGKNLSVLFHVTNRSGLKLAVANPKILIRNCTPLKDGEFQIDHVEPIKVNNNEQFFQWYTELPAAPSRCEIQLPRLTIGDKEWEPPVLKIKYSTTKPLPLNLPAMPSH